MKFSLFFLTCLLTLSAFVINCWNLHREHSKLKLDLEMTEQSIQQTIVRAPNPALEAKYDALKEDMEFLTPIFDEHIRQLGDKAMETAAIDTDSDSVAVVEVRTHRSFTYQRLHPEKGKLEWYKVFVPANQQYAVHVEFNGEYNSGYSEAKKFPLPAGISTIKVTQRYSGTRLNGRIPNEDLSVIHEVSINDGTPNVWTHMVSKLNKKRDRYPGSRQSIDPSNIYTGLFARIRLVVEL